MLLFFGRGEAKERARGNCSRPEAHRIPCDSKASFALFSEKQPTKCSFHGLFRLFRQQPPPPPRCWCVVMSCPSMSFKIVAPRGDSCTSGCKILLTAFQHLPTCHCITSGPSWRSLLDHWSVCSADFRQSRPQTVTRNV